MPGLLLRAKEWRYQVQGNRVEVGGGTGNIFQGIQQQREAYLDQEALGWTKWISE